MIWPCILFSCEVPLPKSVFAHGFVLASDGRKMSKSLGNIVEPSDILAKHNPDMIRYYLTREPIYGDDFPFDELQEELQDIDCWITNEYLTDVINEIYDSPSK